MNYILKDNKTYEAIDGYIFKCKANGYLFKGMVLSDNDSIENYEVIEEPIETPIEEATEPTYEELLEMYKNQEI